MSQLSGNLSRREFHVAITVHGVHSRVACPTKTMSPVEVDAHTAKHRPFAVVCSAGPARTVFILSLVAPGQMSFFNPSLLLSLSFTRPPHTHNLSLPLPLSVSLSLSLSGA